MTALNRSMVVDVNLEPIQGSETGKTRPIDHRARLRHVRGELDGETLHKIDNALKIVFAL
ncbi:MAG: hypothetical protein WCI11_05980 [Candidatus Methylumidiphilus sp.]